MSWLLYPKKPTEEYRQALKELGRDDPTDDDSLSFSTSSFGLLSEFFGNNGIIFTGYEGAHGALVANLSEELCQQMADFLEKNGPFTAEQLPLKWRANAASTSASLMKYIPIWRYSGGIHGGN